MPLDDELYRLLFSKLSGGQGSSGDMSMGDLMGRPAPATAQPAMDETRAQLMQQMQQMLGTPFFGSAPSSMLGSVPPPRPPSTPPVTAGDMMHSIPASPSQTFGAIPAPENRPMPIPNDTSTLPGDQVRKYLDATKDLPGIEDDVARKKFREVVKNNVFTNDIRGFLVDKKGMYYIRHPDGLWRAMPTLPKTSVDSSITYPSVDSSISYR